MKIKVLGYFVINKLKANQKNILDIQIIDEEEGLLVNKKFINNEKELSFVIRSVGHINPSVENYYPVTVEIDEGNDIKDYKDQVFTDS